MKRFTAILLIFFTAAICISQQGSVVLADDVVISSDITTSTTWTRDNTYILNGIIFVTNGASLTIEPGTVVRGRSDSETPGTNNPGALVVARGSKIFADGTCTDPIVFTDMNDDNVPGGAKTNPLYNNNPNNMITENWGGVILLGNTYIANDTEAGPDPSREEQIEGITRDAGVFGGGNDDDSSGSMSYVSIRYGGFGLLPNEEINGLTMGAVGRGTTLHHIEVVNNVDDGFEWFGGTVNSKYLITWNIGDDSMDTDRGYRGKSQFGLVVKGVCKNGESSSGGGVANRAFEMDGGTSPDNSRPFALSQWRNYTLIGMGSGTTDPASDDDTGIEIRDNGRPQIYHTIVMDMGADAVDIEDLDDPAVDSAGGWTTAYDNYPDAASFYPAQQQGMQTEIADCLFYNISGAIDEGGIGVMAPGKQNMQLTTSPIQNVSRQAAIGYSDILVVSALDPRPTAAAVGIQRQLPTDGFFTPVDYYGAFSADNNWAEGWSLIHAMGVLSTEEPGPSFENRLYYPHVASDGTWETEICVINTSGAQALNGVFKAYDNTGGFISEIADVSLASHARREITVGDEFSGPANIGYIIFESDSDSFVGYTKFYIEGQFRVAIPAVSEINTGDIYISHIASDANWATGVSLLNTTSSTKNLTIEFDNGQTRTVEFSANEHKAFTVSSLFNNSPQPDIESAVVKDADGIVGLELFTSGALNWLSGILLKDETTTTIYYPHITTEDGWATGIVATNPSDADCDITITPYSAEGMSLPPTSLTIGANEKYIGPVSELSLPVDTAWLMIDASNPITGFELFSRTNQLAGYTGVGIAGMEGVFAKLDKEGATGVAFVNIENGLANVTLTAYDDSGAETATENISLNAYEKVIGSAENLFPGKDISSATYISYSSDREIVGFQLNISSDNRMLDALPGMR